MKSVFLREQKRYTQNELMQIFDCSESKMVRILKRLKEYGVAKAVKAMDSQKELSDLYEEDVQIADVEEGENEYMYVFPFVGVVTLEGIVLKCYPKYIVSNDSPISELKLILRVLSKYNSKEEIIRMYNESSDSSAFNMLAVMLYLLNDYHENGAYTNTDDVIEINGTGEIIWEKTINETFTMISTGRPYYPELLTRKRIIDEHDYFKRLHESIVSICTKQLRDADLLDLFDILGADISDEEISDFGDKEFILDAIEKELNVQYNTRKQLLLKTLYAYIVNNGKVEGLDYFSMYGTNSFNLVWENVCSEVIHNKLHTKIKMLNLGRPLDDKFQQCKEKTLIELIEKPSWNLVQVGKEYETETMIPDLITVGAREGAAYFAIFDAKYYCMNVKNSNLKGNPGIESINKQYLYQLAYSDFIEAHRLTTYNCFLFPTENKEIINAGYVELKMLSRLGLSNIELRLLPADKMYMYYLQGVHINALDVITS